MHNARPDYPGGVAHVNDAMSQGNPADSPAFTLELPGVTWWSDDALRDHPFPDLQWLIPSELPVGYTVILGAPKTGKTALILPIAHRLAGSGMRVLYLKLDDSLRRMRGRTIMANPKPAGHEGPWGYADLFYLDGWRPRNAYEAFGQLGFWLGWAAGQGHPFDVVIVDTYGRFVGRRPQGDVFGFDYEVGERFKQLCEVHSVSVMVTHHTRKGAGAEEDWLDVVSGSAGITAAADAIWYITRTRGGRDGILRITGNDMEEIEKPVVLGSDMVWRFNDAISPGQGRHTGTPRLVLDHLHRVAEDSARGIAEALGAQQNTVHVALQRLAADGLVEVARRGRDQFWSLTLVPDNQVGSGPRNGAAPPSESGGPAPAPARPDSVPAPVPSGPAPTSDPSPPDPIPGGEATPLYSGSSRATSKMIECLTVNPDGSKRRLYPAFTLEPWVKELAPYDAMCLGGKSNQWNLWPASRPAGLVMRVDRKAAYWSSSAWMCPNVLTRRGPMTMEEVAHEKWAGIFQIATTPWVHRHLPSPYGAERPRARELVTRATLNRLSALARQGHMEMPRILMGAVGRGTERLMDGWMDWCLAERRRAAGDPELAQLIKDDQNLAIGNLRVIGQHADGSQKSPGPVDRWDWQYAFISHHYAMVHLWALRALMAGEPLIGLGNTDELVFLIPDGAGPDWRPASMVKLFEKHYVAVKGIEDAGEWWDRGGRGFKDGGK